MRTGIVWVVVRVMVAALVSFGLVACGSDSTTTATTYSISGTIAPSIAPQGVTMTLSGPSSATVTTDTSGKYTFSGLSNGTYTLTPGKSGYTFNPSSSAQTINNANSTGVNFAATAFGVNQFDGTYTGSWSRLCPTCGTTPPDNQSNSGIFSVDVANGVFANIYISAPVPGAGAPYFVSGTVSSSGAIAGTGSSPSQCSSSTSIFTGQTTTTLSGSAGMTITYTRTASPEGCQAESGSITATRTP